MKRKYITISIMIFTLLFTSVMTSYAGYVSTVKSFTYSGITIPSCKGYSYKVVNKNDPRFTKKQKKSAKKAFEKYYKLDEKGRPTKAYASLNSSLMPDYSRASISMVKPVGWVQSNYKVVSGGWLYNRCHLIGFQLTGIDGEHKADFLERNLITGTRFLNVGKGEGGMVKFENKVSAYLKANPGNHVLYRVTPVYRYKSDILARGLLIEGESIEDDEIEFCVFCYNVQPGVSIDYKTGKSKLTKSSTSTTSTKKYCYITNTGKKYHYKKTCAGSSATKVKVSRAKSLGLDPCKKCAKN